MIYYAVNTEAEMAVVINMPMAFNVVLPLSDVPIKPIVYRRVEGFVIFPERLMPKMTTRRVDVQRALVRLLPVRRALNLDMLFNLQRN